MTVEIGLVLLGGVWAAGASAVMLLVWKWVREQRRDARVERAVYRAACEKAKLEAIFSLPAFGEELA